MDRLAHLIKIVHRGFVRGLQLRLTQESVAIGHWVFLRLLWEEDGLTQRELSHRSNLVEPTTFSALLAMEQLGYIRRARSSDDRRKVRIFLTSNGRKLQQTLSPFAQDVNDVAVEGIDPAHLPIIRAALVTMHENLTADERRFHDEDKRVPSTRGLTRKPRQPPR